VGKDLARVGRSIIRDCDLARRSSDPGDATDDPSAEEFPCGATLAQCRRNGIATLTGNWSAHVLLSAMMPISYARHRFPPEVIRHAVWLYLRFTLSYRDVEDLLTERGLIVSNESIRRWVLKFGPVIARNLRGLRPKAYTRWHLDEMVVSLSGKQMYMWRAVDGEGEVLDILVQPKRDKAAAL
jgi:DDE superfamily endonuclease